MEFVACLMWNLLKKYPLSIIVLAMICYLSFFSPPETNLEKVKFFDKIVHFLMYAGLCVVLWFEYFLTHDKVVVQNVFWWAILLPVSFSGLIELAQEYLTEGRSGDIFDLLFNSLGVAFAALFSLVITKPVMIKLGWWNKRGNGGSL